MVLRFLLLAGTFILASCVSIERNNPDDPGGINFQAGSSSLGGSSNSVAYVSKGKDIANYKTKEIGTQIWMAENLDNDVSGSRCYDNNPANCAIYGRLYYWEIARTACPDGWHLPTFEDWNILMKYVNPNCSDIDIDVSYAITTCAGAGKLLKAASGWADCTGASDIHGSKGNGTDDFGFAALPGGSIGGIGGAIGSSGVWLSSSVVDNWRNLVSGLEINSCGDDARFSNGISNDKWYSVRCVKD